ncbi:MAG: hypothetical protein U0167_14050 [bacterium]
MKRLLASIALLGSSLLGAAATAHDLGQHVQPATTVFFQEDFNASSLDPSIWRTDIVTSGSRWCDGGGYWFPGQWVPEGTACGGVVAHSPYGGLNLSGGLLHMTSGDYAFPYLVSRLPGPAQLFPATGDWSLEARLRCDRESPWGTFLTVMQTSSTEPSGTNPVTQGNTIIMQLSATSGSWDLWSALDGSNEHRVARWSPPTSSPSTFSGSTAGAHRSPSASTVSSSTAR